MSLRLIVSFVCVYPQYNKSASTPCTKNISVQTPMICPKYVYICGVLTADSLYMLSRQNVDIHYYGYFVVSLKCTKIYLVQNLLVVV